MNSVNGVEAGKTASGGGGVMGKDRTAQQERGGQGRGVRRAVDVLPFQ